MPVSSKEFLDIQANIECGFTLKCVCDMTRTYRHCRLLIGNSRVGPLKFISIPRLELMAAALSVKISNLLREELDVHVDDETFGLIAKLFLATLTAMYTSLKCLEPIASNKSVIVRVRSSDISLKAVTILQMMLLVA